MWLIKLLATDFFAVLEYGAFSWSDEYDDMSIQHISEIDFSQRIVQEHYAK